MSLSKLIREPLIQFLIIGACIYGAYAFLGSPDDSDADYTIVVDAARVEGFVSGWQSRMGRAPTPSELGGMIDQYLKEEILYREAKAMGLGEDDPVTRRRMSQKLEFLTRDVARLKEPKDGELEAYFEANIADFRDPDLITFTHVFLDPDKRGDATLADAEALLTKLKAQGEPNGQTRELGDRFMLQNYFPQKSELDIRRQFGAGFSRPLMELEPGQWHGPVLSGYGTHLVYVHALMKAPEPVIANVREQVYRQWMEAQQEQFNEDYLASLKSRYEIIYEVEVPESAANEQDEAAVQLRDSEAEPVL